MAEINGSQKFAMYLIQNRISLDRNNLGKNESMTFVSKAS